MSLGALFSRFVCLLFLLAAAVEPNWFYPSSAAQPTTKPEPTEVAPRTLEAGITQSQDLADEPHVYRVKLEAEHYVELVIIKGDLNLSAKVFGPQGELLGEFFSTGYERLGVSFISTHAGQYRMEVHSLEQEKRSRRYDLKVEVKRKATVEDRKLAAASRYFAEAVKLRTDWREPSLREAISKYAAALAVWQSTGRANEAAKTLDNIGDIYFTLGENRQALDHYLQALKVGRKVRDHRAEIRGLIKIGYVHVYLGQGKKAHQLLARVLNSLSRAPLKSPEALDDEDRRIEAEAQNAAGEAYYSLGNPRRSVDSFNEALNNWTAVHDRSGQALGNLNLGYAYSDLGDLTKAQAHFSDALTLSQEIGERRGAARALTAQGSVHAFLGEKQTALDHHARAMDIFRTVGDHEGQAIALNSIGKAYEDLNEPQTALDNYTRALKIYQERGHRDYEAVTRYYLGRVHNSLGDKKRAFEFYRQSMLQGRESGQQRVIAYALSAISALRSSEGNQLQALSELNHVLRLYRRLGDRRGQANTLNNIGQIHRALGNNRRALFYYRRALPLSRVAGDRTAEAATLYHIARIENDPGTLDDALKHIQESIKTIESLRSLIVSPELRASYFASVHKHLELYIDLLMKLDKLRPGNGFAAMALQANENARARALFEILGEASAQIRQGVDKRLLERERSLQQLLSAKAAYQMRVLGASSVGSDEVEETNREIRDLNVAYQEVQSQIKQQSPRYATLVQPQPLPLEDIQAELQDPDTLLLEYALGEERSFLWAVTSTSVASYELPSRSIIEESVRELYSLLTLRQSLAVDPPADYQEQISFADSHYWQKGAHVSQMLLGPVAAQLGKKRLLIVTDGALQYLPFEALPAPGSGLSWTPENNGTYPPLVLDHEIINLPSASTLAVIRRTAPTETGQKLVAILADPVFERDDPRVRASTSSSSTAVAEITSSDSPRPVLKELPAELTNISRLPATRHEGEAIMNLTSAGEGMLATDFNASRSIAMSGELGRYRIVHFATHGIIDTEYPQLSGIMLSTLNREGKREEGFLQLHDVYNLDLSGTQLVVLSACRTGLGKDVKGEGLMGLTRGFMYAGSRSVIASLWKVDDRATAELMKHFYQAMFDDGLTPAAALRKAKQTMWEQERWRPPYFWAAFVLQGEYRDPIPVARHGHNRSLLIYAGILLGLIPALYILIRLRRNARARQT